VVLAASKEIRPPCVVGGCREFVQRRKLPGSYIQLLDNAWLGSGDGQADMLYCRIPCLHRKKSGWGTCHQDRADLPVVYACCTSPICRMHESSYAFWATCSPS
jgi:hypothetical protein